MRTKEKRREGSWLGLLMVFAICSVAAIAQATPLDAHRTSAIHDQATTAITAATPCIIEPAAYAIPVLIDAALIAEPLPGTTANLVGEPAATNREPLRLTAHGLDDHLAAGSTLGWTTVFPASPSAPFLC